MTGKVCHGYLQAKLFRRDFKAVILCFCLSSEEKQEQDRP